MSASGGGVLIAGWDGCRSAQRCFLKADPEELRHARSGQAGIRQTARYTHIPAMHLDLSDDETAALATELKRVINDDRYPLSSRIRTLQGILDRLDPPPVRQPFPPLKTYAPPRAKPGQHRGQR